MRRTSRVVCDCCGIRCGKRDTDGGGSEREKDNDRLENGGHGGHSVMD